MREAKFSHDFLGDSEFRGYTRLGGHLKSGHVWSLENRP